jgi:hypothetical protein
MENKLLVTLNVNELQELITDSVTNALSKIPKPRQDDDSLLKRKDIARLFSVSLVTVTQWMKTGRLPYHRINSRIFFKKGEVLQAMELSPKYKNLKSTI